MTKHNKINKNSESLEQIDYSKLWWTKNNNIVSEMIKSPIYTNWKNDSWKMFEEFLDKFSLNVKSIDVLFTTSLINRVATIKSNWISKGNFEITPYIYTTIKILKDEKNLIKEVFPSYNDKIKQQIQLTLNYLDEIINFKNSKNTDTFKSVLRIEEIFEMLFDKLNKEKISLNSDIEEYLNNPAKFMVLSDESRSYFWDEWLASLLHLDKMHLFEIRFTIINNLWKWVPMNVKTLSDVLDFKNTNGEKMIYFIPLIKNLNTSTDEKIYIKKDTNIDVPYLIKTCTETEMVEWVKNQKRLSFIDNTSLFHSIDERRDIIYHEPKEKVVDNIYNFEDIDLDSLGTKKFRIEDKLSDYIPLFTYDLKLHLKTIKKIILNENGTTDQKLASFTKKCIDSIYSFKDNNNQVDIFLSFWFIIESVRVHFSSHAKYNDGIKDTIFQINKYKFKNIDSTSLKDLLDEIVMFRNTLIHGAIPNTARVGAFNLILSTTVYVLLEYTITNYNKFAKISFPDFLTIMKYDV